MSAREITHHPEAYDIILALEPLASKAVVKAAHWIVTPKGELWTNKGGDWCRECATFMIRHLRKKDRENRDEYILDGGWRSEHDTTIHCCQCGVRLDGSLLSYGALEELDYFRENPPRAGNVDDIYSVSEMLNAFEYTSSGNDKFALEAIEIGRALATAIRSLKGGAG